MPCNLSHDLLILVFYSFHYIASDINSEGYTVNATKYEATLFIDESANAVPEGTYLFTIGIIPVTLDISTVVEFIASVTTQVGPFIIYYQTAQGASVEQIVVSTLDFPLHVGVYSLSISLAIIDFDNPDQGISHVTEAEVWVLPLRKCMW